jgi:serine/threonine protein kinase
MKDDSPGFNNTVDIWATGCILFELATGAKPFGNDNAVGEYSRGGSEVEAHCHVNIGIDMAKKISDAIYNMLQIRPSLRPKSAELAELFDKYYRLANDQRVRKS